MKEEKRKALVSAVVALINARNDIYFSEDLLLKYEVRDYEEFYYNTDLRVQGYKAFHLAFVLESFLPTSVYVEIKSDSDIIINFR